MTSANDPDWPRETPLRFWDPSRKLLRAIRRYQSAGKVTRRWWALSHRFWSVVTGADIPLVAKIGGGLRIPHPNGIVVHSDAEIGPNCTIMAQVTLGTDRSGRAPVLGGHVDIGSGAKVIGPVRVGDHVQIGANAVVVKDVPDGATAVGIPARILTPAP